MTPKLFFSFIAVLITGIGFTHQQLWAATTGQDSLDVKIKVPGNCSIAVTTTQQEHELHLGNATNSFSPGDAVVISNKQYDLKVESDKSNNLKNTTGKTISYAADITNNSTNAKKTLQGGTVQDTFQNEVTTAATGTQYNVTAKSFQYKNEPPGTYTDKIKFELSC